MKDFNSWRQRKMSYYARFDCERHYHRCSDLSYSCVAEFLQQLIAYRINNGSGKVVVTITDEFADAALAFLDEMQFAYIHPRSTSHKFIMNRENGKSPC